MRRPRFDHVVVLHDGGDEWPGGPAAELTRHLRHVHPGLTVASPEVGYGGRVWATPGSDGAAWARGWARRNSAFVERRYLVVGLGLGGLVACAAQDALPSWGLAVFAVNSPTREGGVSAWDIPARAERFSLFSGAYAPIAGRCGWEAGRNASGTADVAWLADGVGRSHHALAYMVNAFLCGADMDRETRLLLPARALGEPRQR